jgi:hypothetical protein
MLWYRSHVIEYQLHRKIFPLFMLSYTITNGFIVIGFMLNFSLQLEKLIGETIRTMIFLCWKLL